MKMEQVEAHILSLVNQLPILRRIRLALTILKQAESSQIPIEDALVKDEISAIYKGDEELAQRILNRKDSYLKDEGKNISLQGLMSKIYAEISSES